MPIHPDSLRADKHAARYDSGRRSVKIQTFGSFLRDLSDQVVLDAGCGTGDVSAICSDRGARIVALDVSEGMLRKVRDRYGGDLFLVRGSAQSLPFKRDTFALVLSIDVFEHLVDPDAFLREAQRVLRSGGHLILATDNTAHIGAVIKKLKRRQREHRPGRRTYQRHYPVRVLTRMAAEAGLQLTRFDTYPDVASVPAFGRFIEMVGQGPLRRFKWGHALYEFTNKPS